MKREPLKIVVVGLGYIGLPTAVVLANAGFRVLGVDTNAEIVGKISSAHVTIAEPGLGPELEKAIQSGRLTAHTQMQRADAYVIAVPTPFRDDHTGDTSYIEASARNIAPLLEGDELVILESTSPPLTTRKLAQWLVDARPDLTVNPDESASGHKKLIHLAYCPERILPGKALEELVENDRIIGGMTSEATKRGREIYEAFCHGELLETDDVTAEMAKLTENSFRDVNIAFANELSIISEKLGIDVWELIELANHHPRVNILQPGPGVGGHCIAVDPWFIVSSAPENTNLIRTAREVNDTKPDWVVGKVKDAIRANPRSTVAVLGLAFKANIDDLRESPAVSIVAQLAEQAPTTTVLVVEPYVTALPPELKDFSNVSLTDLELAVTESSVILVLVDHTQFDTLDRETLQSRTVIDTKGLLRHRS